MSQNNLSNIDTVSLVNITSDNPNINISTKTLSNVAAVSVQTITSDNTYINVNTKSLSNLGNVLINPDGILSANEIAPSTGTSISFKGNNLTGIQDLVMSGDLRVRGEFFVLNTTTCNTNQLRVENDSTGPALVVNQLGSEHITQFQDDSNVVFFIKNGGQSAFGNFGKNIITSIPSALVYMQNPTASNQTALYVQQDAIAHDIATFQGAGKRVLINAQGNVGVGTTNPLVPLAIHDTSAILIPSGTTSQRPSDAVQGYIRYNTELSSFEGLGANNSWGTLGGVKDVDGNTYIAAELYAGANDDTLRFFTNGSERMRVTNMGQVGIGTTQPNADLDVVGTAHIPTLHTDTITTLDALSSVINVSTKSLSNVNVVSLVNLTSDIQNINVSTKSFSNVQAVSVASITSDQNNINISTRSLSNIQTISVVNVTSDIDNINISNKTLSNVSVVSTSKITSDAPNINVSNKTLSNVNVLSVSKLSSDSHNIDVSYKTLNNINTVDTSLVRTSSIASSNSAINFQLTDLENIRNASFNGVTINSSESNALLVTQSNASFNIAYFRGGSCNIVIDGSCKVGYGISTGLNARFHVAHGVSDASTDLMRFSTTSDPHAFNISGTGSVGVRTSYVASNALTASGIIQSDSICTPIITSYSPNININAKSLSNINNINATTLDVTKINNINGISINVSQTSLSNINITHTSDLVATTKIITPAIASTNNNVSFNFNKILDIDSLIVRSNITVTLQGTNTYTNLPSDVVRLDPQTGRILDQYINDAFVRLMAGSNTINANLLPAVDTNRKTLMHTKDRVGIGLKNPTQKLHIHGNQAITSGRLGIGTAYPGSILHIVDNNGPSPTVHIEQQGSVDILRIVGSNASPVLYVSSFNNIGIRTSAPSSNYSLDVNGGVYVSGFVRTNALESDTGTIDGRQTSLSNILVAHIRDAIITNSLTAPSTVSTSNIDADFISTDTITNKSSSSSFINMHTGLRVTGFSTSLFDPYTLNTGDPLDQTKIGLRVNHNVMAQSFLSISDRRIKQNIIPSDSQANLQTVLELPVCTFSMKDPYMDQKPMLGFIAQEVEEIAPYAVKTTHGPVPNIMRYPDEVKGHTIVMKQHGLARNAVLKLLVQGEEVAAKVVDIVDGDSFIINRTLSHKPEDVLVYGEVVSNFKLIESERLLPLAFGAIKELHKKSCSQQTLIDDILDRLKKIEDKIIPA
jgi:hypothetical protein